MNFNYFSLIKNQSFVRLYRFLALFSLLLIIFLLHFLKNLSIILTVFNLIYIIDQIFNLIFILFFLQKTQEVDNKLKQLNQYFKLIYRANLVQ